MGKFKYHIAALLCAAPLAACIPAAPAPPPRPVAATPAPPRAPGVSDLEHPSASTVVGGDVIGRSGATGQVQTSQLHFQLRKNRIPVDPMKQLPAR